MKERLIAVLIGTLLALVAATLWVPMRLSVLIDANALLAPPGDRPTVEWAGTEWRFLWNLGDPAFWEVSWGLLALQLAVVAAVGGLLALILRTRGNRAAA